MSERLRRYGDSRSQQQGWKRKMAKKVEPATVDRKRSNVKQSDVPGAALAEALRIPAAIHENFAGKPTPPLMVAKALNVDPGGTQLKRDGSTISDGAMSGISA